MKKFNDWFGSKLSLQLSTMACFYIVTFLVIMPLFWQRPVGLVGWMQYAISVLFQGSALPLLGYVARVSGEKSEELIKETHDTVMQEFELIKEELELAKAERDELKEIHELIKPHL